MSANKSTDERSLRTAYVTTIYATNGSTDGATVLATDCSAIRTANLPT
jgi:hypothetical protein